MAKRIVAGLIVVVVILAGYWAYTRYTGNQRLRDGDVTVADTGEAVQATPSRSDAPGTVNTVPVARTESASNSSASLSQLANRFGASAPATDTQSPDAPNGAAFTGSGPFQVYRQGNLTWRLNTSDGTTCILFATDEEWRKPIVYSHGCPTS